MKKDNNEPELLLMKYLSLPEVAREYVRLCVPANKRAQVIEDLIHDFKEFNFQDILN